jgi:hypothetical protein
MREWVVWVRVVYLVETFEGHHVDQKKFFSKPSTPNAKSKLLAQRHHFETHRR